MKSILCRPRSLPGALRVAAARQAVEINPANAPDIARITAIAPGFSPTPLHIAMVTKKYWGAGNVRLTVGFMDNPPQDLRARILLHMNAWSKNSGVRFVASQTDPVVRIARLNSPPDDAGYWSYVGTDVRSIDRTLPTMNLEGFTMKTRESEFVRVVRHEAGHTLGFEHEHLRAELVSKIDVAKAITYFRESDGWDEAMTRAQVLTPIAEKKLTTSGSADPDSIMCYEIPGEITTDGNAIVGGDDINATDYAFVAKVYPKPKSKPKPKTKLKPKSKAKSKKKAVKPKRARMR